MSSMYKNGSKLGIKIKLMRPNCSGLFWRPPRNLTEEKPLRCVRTVSGVFVQNFGACLLEHGLRKCVSAGLVHLLVCLPLHHATCAAQMKPNQRFAAQSQDSNVRLSVQSQTATSCVCSWSCQYQSQALEQTQPELWESDSTHWKILINVSQDINRHDSQSFIAHLLHWSMNE